MGDSQALQPTYFIKIAQNMRWLILAMLLISYPWAGPEAMYVGGLAVAVAVYNALYYTPYIRGIKSLRILAVIICIDSLIIAAFLILTGGADSPYRPIVVFMLITAAYFYRLKGVALIILLEAAIILIVDRFSFFPSIHLDAIRYDSLLIFILLGIGFYVERLTHQDKVERDLLRQLRQRSDERRLRLLALINSLSFAIFVTDEKGGIILYNEAARIMANIKDEGQHLVFTKALPLYKRADPHRAKVNIFQEQSSVQRRRDLSTDGGENGQIDLDIDVTPVSQGDADTEYLIVCSDISQERTLEEERTEFISVASHELRTPITIVEAALGSLLRSEKTMSKSGYELLEQAHRNTIQLGGIVKDLSVLAESQNDNIPIDLGEINPSEMIASCVSDFRAQVKNKGLELNYSVEPQVPFVISTERYIREILQNY
ncbi:hypothetical protein KDA08_04915, partial [Candidatus Saccharibacteria bacterium]|nr:hypothetical protein [Candidatus Saccharibacteria bacterium]